MSFGDACWQAWVFVTCETTVRHVTNDRFTRDEHLAQVYLIFRKTMLYVP